MKTDTAARKILAWLGLFFSLIFVSVGLAMLTGLIFGEHVIFNQGIRTVVGLALMGYGIVRGFTIYRQTIPPRKGAEDAQK